ncbi:hypothetical protein [Streptomyces antimicrobicus]|uniref:Secreted protein n=1 Tax=Streptomyces antimicrobicus TaxID=2883108 RepID=A0ABS8B3F4_9ACTN|nr:hypothetical protein [Streptomyces antimicrobicus]MCB5179117.1 hypothetical protein [Streptomyces antimicrobicus]
MAITSRAHAPAAGGTAPVAPPRRGTAFAEGAERVRRAATTEPGRLRIVGAVLAALAVLFGVAAGWEVSDRTAAAEDVVGRSQPLAAGAASIYRSLADADAAASSGFLTGGQEPRELRERYEKDIATASRLLVEAAADAGEDAGDDDAGSRREIALLGEQLPRYAGLVEQARATDRQGLPLGGAYLRYANEQMSTLLLPAAQRLYEAETRRLHEDHDDARAWPPAALVAGLAALGALGWAQRREYRRTHRVFNPGLVAATAATAVALLWLAVGHGVARAELGEARSGGQESLKVLDAARVAALQARADENLTMISRGAVQAADRKSDKYEVDFARNMDALDSGLAAALRLADDEAGRAPLRRAAAGVQQWKERHAQAREADLKGDYESALPKVIGGRDSSGASFDVVDASLEQAVTHEQAEFTEVARGGLAALTGLVPGTVALTLTAAAAALLGIGRRLSEYR